MARRDKDDTRPVIGIGPLFELKLWPIKMRTRHELPVIYHTAAAKAVPPFQFDDVIVGTTDPHRPDDLDRIEPLPLDPRFRRDDPPHSDYFEFRRRLQGLAGKPMTIQVRRDNSPEPVNIQVPPAYYRTLGLRMPMGKITAVRAGSPAAKAGFKENDLILKVGDMAVKDPSTIVDKVRGSKSGDKLTIRIKRGDKEMDVTVKPVAGI